MIKRIEAPEEVLFAVSRLLDHEGLSVALAAQAVGVSQSTMSGHLAIPPRSIPGPRSLALYRRFLRSRAGAAEHLPPGAEGQRSYSACSPDISLLGSEEPVRPKRPYVVVDLFSGCGGLSLGFDLYDSGSVFETVLALDLEAPMIDVLNANRRAGAKVGPGRRTNIEEFLNEVEILAFYLDHYASTKGDADLRRALDALPRGGLTKIKSKIEDLDRHLEDDLKSLRRKEAYRSALRTVHEGTFMQTSVEAFAHRLQLPLLGSRWKHTPLLWEREPSAQIDSKNSPYKPQPDMPSSSKAMWDREVKRLRSALRDDTTGESPVASKKIASFLRFLQSSSAQQVRRVWGAWSAERLATRRQFFGDPRVGKRLKALYAKNRRVDIVLGGPPCQGFSRIGRGKIRSLQDGGANIHTHEGAGDVRNLLFEKYVQFVSALQPDVFLFENVATFRTEVRTIEGSFQAADALEEAFERVSSGGIHYAVWTRTLQCADHGVPQNRARFFMAGLRRTTTRDQLAVDLAEECLSLKQTAPSVPLGTALQGLPSVTWSKGRGELAQRKLAKASGSGEFLSFLRQSLASGSKPSGVDGHVARLPRRDDKLWYELMAPGTRWMDYRCDGASTIEELKWATGCLAKLKKSLDSAGRLRPLTHAEATGDRVRALADLMNEDLAIHLVNQSRGKLEIAANRTKPDYSCGRAPTLAALRRAVRLLAKVVATSRRAGLTKKSLRGLMGTLKNEELKRLTKVANGSLSVRLLLEQIAPPGKDAGHHLLRDVYLSKRSGHHGDWLKRLDPSVPCRTIVSHMAKDTYAFVHPSEARTLSVREAARIQTFPDDFSFGSVGLFHAFRMIGNAVPPLLSHQLAGRVARILPVLERCSYEPSHERRASSSNHTD